MPTNIPASPRRSLAAGARPAKASETPGWSEADVATLRRMWRAFLPVWAMAADLRRSRKAVQALARELDLPYRTPAAVERAGRMRITSASLRRARAAEEDLYPVAISAPDAGRLAAGYGLDWSGRRGDLPVLNAALERAGQRPVYVPFRQLRP